ncbi:PAS domain S-box protein [Variovorax ginsengisoli]|uniref:histidine kinase n=1 Tax=Variovorax ginsengisoli TaxID=363844 RepID=A0ABT9S9Y1_9BURK|nr:PAS domain S-box protein [Variovorax ginsengisoli]MDP9900182.1 PAS domain S-box-containing protein [Variovorax ginsengisoli]
MAFAELLFVNASLGSAGGLAVAWGVTSVCALVGWQVAQTGADAVERGWRAGGGVAAALVWATGLWAALQWGTAALAWERPTAWVAWSPWPVALACALAVALRRRPWALVWRVAGAGSLALAGVVATVIGALRPMDRALFGLLVTLCAMALLGVCLRVSREVEQRAQPGLWRSGCGAALVGVAGALLAGAAGWGVQRHTVGLGAPQPHPYSAGADVWLLVVVGAAPLWALGLAAVFAMAVYRRQALQAREALGVQRAFLANAPDGLVMTDGEGRILRINPAAADVLGCTDAQAVGRDACALLAPGDAGFETWLHTAPVPADARPDDFESTVLCADGTLRSLRLAVGRLGAFDPAQPCYVISVSDLGRRKAIEHALRASEQQYRTMVGNIPGVSFRNRVDARLTTLFMSDGIVELSGWPAEDFASGRRSLGELLHPADRERVAEEMRTAATTMRSFVTEFRVLHRDGGERWVWQSGSVMQHEGEGAWIDGVLFDITETRRRNAGFEGTVDAVHRVMGVIEFDLDGAILWANARMCGWLGCSVADLHGLHHNDLVEPSLARDTAFNALWQRLRRGEYETGEYRRRTRTGAEFWVQGSYNPIFDADGTPFKVVLLATDLNARRQMERALRDAKERAEQAAAARSQFLANMSHEIRTPMNAIIGFTDVLLDGALDAVQRRHLQTVRQSARALLALLNGVLDTAKLEKGALELEQVDFALRETIEQAVDSLRLDAEHKRLDFSLVWDDALPAWVHGDAHRLRQVVLNLLGNAIKFTAAGSVRLEAAHHGDTLHLAFRDTGIGIAPERLSAIFDPFAQADASTSRRFGGTGLGTTIARQLVELMGGRIEVESRAGEGSTFHVWLPLQAAVPGRTAATEPRCVPPPLDVLAVDDVPENRELLRIALGNAGHRVRTAASAVEAWAALATQPFDVVLMDLHMPEVDGLEAARRVRTREAEAGARRIPIVALTASVLPEDRRSAQAAGMDGFAPKPVDLDQLLDELARVTGRTAIGPVHASPTADAAVIDWVRGLRVWASEPQLLRSLHTFADGYADALPVLAHLLHADDLEGARQYAHRLRGVSGNVGCDRVQAVAAQVEMALIAGDRTDAKARLPALAATLREVAQALQQRRPPIPDAGGAVGGAASADRAPLTRTATQAWAARLLRDVQHSELGSDDASLRAFEHALRAHGEAPAAAALGRALDLFDFQAAQALLAALAARLLPDGQPARETTEHT